MSKRGRGAITTAHLKTLLSRIGSGVSGTKPELTGRFHSDLNVPKLQNGGSGSSSTSRILSVDMGIRNMAFCVCDVSVQPPSKALSSASPRVKLEVIAWEPISVSDLARQEEEQASSTDPAVQLSSQLTQAAKESFRPSVLSRAAYALLKRKLLPYAPQTILIEQQRYRTNASSAIQEWTYHVNMLEGMIWAILETLRQEGAAASGRLPTAAPAEAPSFPSVFPVSPARVASFWMDNSETGRAILAEASANGASVKRSSPRSRAKASKTKEEDVGAEAVAEEEEEEGTAEDVARASKGEKKKRLSKTKIEKKVKIKLVEQWLLTNASRSASARPDCDVQLHFGTAGARGMRDVFLSKLARAAKRTGGGGSSSTSSTRKKLAKDGDASEAPAAAAASAPPPIDPKKLDDLADCLLQAAAWAQWEGNRRALVGLEEQALREVAEL
ncbi:hypothetical protein DIS24_g5481 [Lasiodiplodia hormozganensis]|uniref:Mitochondrial resolvase Ydc2 catalytic domain-containing protein n=1 Tax=Lasiodiplodia hormozganensis TaxID=869390 RepID=A0AA40CWG0_9PEZI|nr:hypothetical protein DIS24_g5481 [Lasiodiplodia hormozganensis]